MKLREINTLLARWQQLGLLSEAQADAIRAYEAEERADTVEEDEGPAFDIGSLLSYGGALVALGAVLGLYATLFDDIGRGGGIMITWAGALAAAGLAYAFARAEGGDSAADATGFAATILLAWAVLETFGAFDDDLSEARLAWILTSVAVAVAGYALARYLPAPMAAASSVVALAWAAAVLGGWIGGGDGPGILGWQFAVITGLVFAGVALLNLLELESRATLWWLVGGLGFANVAAFVLSAEEGGAYEALLLAYAIGLGVVAIVARRKVVLVFAALFLYEWVGFVVFRTFEGAVAAIIVTALIGLGTAVGGIAVQRGLVDQLWRFRNSVSGGDSSTP